MEKVLLKVFNGTQRHEHYLHVPPTLLKYNLYWVCIMIIQVALHFNTITWLSIYLSLLTICIEMLNKITEMRIYIMIKKITCAFLAGE